MTGRPNVLFIGRYWEERFLAGISDYARKAGWKLYSGLRRSHLDLPPGWKGDGMIVNSLGEPGLVDYVHKKGVPTVAADPYGAAFGAPMVYNDESAIGRAAAEYFLGLGFTNFGFVSVRQSMHNGRSIGFEKALRKVGKRCSRIALEDLPFLLESLPKPMALMASNDNYALDAMYDIEAAGYQVPEDFALVGVDDDEITCSLCSVPLTSVNLDFEGRAYRCAEILDLLMRGERPPQETILWPIRGITVRRSTDTIVIPHPGAAKALQFIRENYRRNISLTDLETHLGTPLRRIQDIFKHHVGCSLSEEISRLRLKAAMEMLRTTNLKLDAIAQECGYSGRVHLTRAIRRTQGLSPRALRWKLREEESQDAR